MSVRTQVTWNGTQAQARERAGAAAGLRAAMEHLLAESRAIVPLDEATLQRSGVASVDESSLTGAVSYDTPYAVPQHENLTWRHLPGRQAKYLEQPAITERDTMLALVAAQVRRALR